MNSVLQKNRDRCYLCGRTDEALDKHHIYGGALRGKSEKYGAFVFICHTRCHIFGENSVHVNHNVDMALKAKCQQELMRRNGWNIDDFRKEFYKNYCEVKNNEQS